MILIFVVSKTNQLFQNKLNVIKKKLSQSKLNNAG